MTPATIQPPATMPEHRHLTPARQSAILEKFQFAGDDLVRVQALAGTMELLRMSGVCDPMPFQHYFVRVCRDRVGFLIVDKRKHAKLGMDEGDELFDVGGLLAGEKPGPPAEETAVEVPPNFFTDLKTAIQVRRFEVLTGPTSKVRFEIVAYDAEDSGEWKPREASDRDSQAGLHALVLGRDLKRYEC